MNWLDWLCDVYCYLLLFVCFVCLAFDLGFWRLVGLWLCLVCFGLLVLVCLFIVGDCVWVVWSVSLCFGSYTVGVICTFLMARLNFVGWIL